MNTQYYLVNTTEELPAHYTVEATLVEPSFTSRDVMEHPLEVFSALHPRVGIEKNHVPKRDMLRNSLKQELSELLSSVDSRALFQLEALVMLLHPQRVKSSK